MRSLYTDTEISHQGATTACGVRYTVYAISIETDTRKTL